MAFDFVGRIGQHSRETEREYQTMRIRASVFARPSRYAVGAKSIQSTLRLCVSALRQVFQFLSFHSFSVISLAPRFENM